MAAALTKTTTVLDHVPGLDPDGPSFCQFSDDPAGEIRNHYMVLDPEVWADMGAPETITVTVEPGDQLNPVARNG